MRIELMTVLNSQYSATIAHAVFSASRYNPAKDYYVCMFIFDLPVNIQL